MTNEGLKGIINSKKFVAAFVAAVFLAFGQFFPAWAEHNDAVQALDSIQWELVARPIYVAIGAQGVADLGKEREKIVNGLKELQKVNGLKELQKVVDAAKGE